MERPRIECIPPVDQYDHEVRPATASFIGLADELLEHKEADSPFTFVDIIVRADPGAAYRRLVQTRVGQLLLKPGDQMAIESDGSYYPILDAPKPDSPPASIGVTVWGWDDDKLRYKGKEQPRGSYPRDIARYAAQQDHTRQIDIRIYHELEETSAVETVGLYGSTSISALPYASRSVAMAEYAETGYEGHDHTQLYDLDDEDIVEFIDLVADIVGDEPLSVGELQAKRFEVFLQKIILPDSRDYIKEWVDNSWDGQVMADLGREELRVGGMSMGQALTTPELAEEAHAVLVELVKFGRLKRG